MAKRPYKPTELKVLEGNRSKKKDLGKGEPKPRPILPGCPDDIDDDAKKTWESLSPVLLRNKLLTEADGDAFAILCQIRSRLKSIHQFIKTGNPSLVQEKVFTDSAGQEHKEYKASPYATMEKQYYQIFRMYAREFGLTPCGRAGLSIKGEEAEGGIEDLLD